MRPIILLSILCTLLSAEPREALLIGNSNYEKITKLNNPKPNLIRLKSTLEGLGFTVKIKTNLNSVNLEEAIDIFAKRLARDRETMGFLYYTGHGCQVERQGYLLPINADSTNKIKVKHHSLKINEMIETLKASGNRVNMFFLDACRDIPVGTKGGSKGLGQIQNTPKGTLVVYATENGQTAEDNSDFINSIISSIKEPNQNIRNLPYSISDIFKQAKPSQTPIFSAVDVPKIVLNSRGGEMHPMKGITQMNGIMYQNQPFSSQDKSNYDNKRNGGRVWDWQGAKNYCENLTLGNYYDWRLPNREELQAIGNIEFYHSYGDYKTAEEWEVQHKAKGQKHLDNNKDKKNSSSKGYKYFVKKAFIENMPLLTVKHKSATFWSSIERDSSFAWMVNITSGYDSWRLKSSHRYSLCVR